MLKRKLLRDLKVGKAQFLSIFFMCFLGMFIYSGIYGEWRGMEEEKINFYEDTNLSDVWIQGEQLSSTPLETIKGIDAYEERILLIGKDTNVDESVMNCYISEDVTISQLEIMDGEVYNKDVNGVWIDALYAQVNHIGIGDTIDIQLGDMKISKTIKGVGYHPEYVYAMKDDTAMMPDHNTFGFVYIPKQSVPELMNVDTNQILVKSNGDHKEVASQIKEAYGQNVQVITQDEHSSVKMVDDEIKQHEAIGTLFPIMFLMIAILTTLNTMSKLVANQRMIIGTLKALGFQKRKLYAHYMSHTLIIALFGSILGSLLGPLFVPNLIYDMQKSMYSLPVWKSHMDFQVVYMLLITISLCILACYLAIHRTLREQAATIMRPKATMIVQRFSYQKNVLWKKLNFYSQWNIRDIFRNKARSIMAVVGIGGCCALLVCSLGLMDSINRMIDDMYIVQHTYESKLNLKSDVSQDDIQLIKQEVNGSQVLEGGALLSINSEEKVIPLTVLEDSNYIKLDQDNTPLPSNGLVVSEKLAKQYGIKVNDTITWKSFADTAWETSTVAMLAYTPLGQGITMSVEEYGRQGHTFQPTSIVSNLASIKNYPSVHSIQYRQDLYRDMDTMLEAMQVLVAVLILAAVILGIVVLYNFTSLSFFERTREMATLKVLGFSDQKIIRLTRSQNLQLCLISVLCGIPLGYSMISFMATTLSETMDMRPHVSLLSYTISIVFTFVITILISQWMARRSKQIDMVSALKSTE